MSQAPSTFGDIVRTRFIGGFDVHDVYLPERLKIPHHIHQKGQMCIVLEGAYLEEARGQQTLLEPGTILFRPPKEVHRNRVGSSKVRTLLVDLEPERLGSLEISKLPAYPIHFSPGILWNSLGAIESELESNMGTEGVILLTIARANRLLGRSHNQKSPEWLEQALKIIRTCYTEKIRLSTLAREVKIHPVTLATVFRRHYHTTVEKCILRLRLDRARQMLLETPMPISEISCATGFYDQSHFGREFKREFSVSPESSGAAANSINPIPIQR